MNQRDKKPGFSESLYIFVSALKISLKTKNAASIIVSILGFPMAFLPVLISVTLRRFSDGVQSLYGAGTSTMGSILGMFALLSSFYIIQLVFQSIRNYFTKLDGMRIKRHIKERILRCTCDVKYKYMENYDDFKDRIRFVDTDAGERVANCMQVIIAWFQSIITFVSIIIVLLGVDVWIVVILCAACIPAVILAYYQKDEEYRSKTLWIHEFLMAVSYFFEATWERSSNDVRFFGIYPYLKEKWRVMNDKYIQKKNKMTRKHVLYNSIADIFRSCVYVFILLIVARRIFTDPTLGIGTFMLVFMMAGQLQDVTARIFIPAAQFISDIAYMRDFFYLDKLEYEARDPAAKPFEKFEIEFQNVSFTYPNTDRKVLHDFTLHIREGEKIAIVGENGSGKTTFVSLLCALYEPDSGSIKVGGKDIYENMSRTRRSLSTVFQDFAHYEATIRENITVSDAKRQISDGELRTLANDTNAWELIEAQPGGLDEMVGSFSVVGTNLSGGQWQKIALARCVYRDSARVMILDEPAAALDPLAEAELYRNFASLTGDRTTLLISHRLGITSLVDRILVFDDGRIVEDGDHKTLIAQDGLYAKMYHAQAQWYE